MILTVKTKILMIIAAVLFATTIGTGVYYISSGGAAVLEVTDFTSMTKEEVLAWAQQHKLSEESIVFRYEYDETAEAETVIAQSPEAGETLKPKDVLELTLSNGPDPDLPVELIDLVGKTQDEAEKWLDQNGFTDIQYRFAADEEAKPDTVLQTEPEAGKTVRRSQRITITVCSGTAGDSETAAEITVPDFSTYTRTNIQAWGSTNKVTIQFQTQTSDTVAKDKVISQTPRAGNKVKQGGSVTVVLSSGKGLTVTSFVGKTKAETDAWIRQTGLKSVMT
jgi:serine/threonine-protein kinase